MGHILEQVVGLLVWLVANGVYVDMRRRGRRSFMRILAFFLGLPATWLTMLLVRPGSQPDIEPPPDDEEALLREVRRDRALRAGPQENPDDEDSGQRSQGTLTGDPDPDQERDG